MSANPLITELPRTVEQLAAQLESDEKRWGNTWAERGRAGQEERIYERFQAYYADWKENGTPIPWLKVMGLAHIALVRERLEGEQN